MILDFGLRILDLRWCVLLLLTGSIACDAKESIESPPVPPRVVTTGNCVVRGSVKFEGTAPADLGCPVHHIHGSDDHMIPLANLRPPPEVVIPGGGHIINVTHANIVNDFIARRIKPR